MIFEYTNNNLLQQKSLNSNAVEAFKIYILNELFNHNFL
jgi:hypothetical protein